METTYSALFDPCFLIQTSNNNFTGHQIMPFDDLINFGVPDYQASEINGTLQSHLKDKNDFHKFLKIFSQQR